MKIFSVTGWSGSGKTTLITKLIRHYKSKGKKIVTIKHAPEKYHLQPESKDTFKFLEAGSTEACLLAKNEFIRMRKPDPQRDIFELLETSFNGYDLMILEGLHRKGIPKIEVYDPQKHQCLKCTTSELSAIVSPIKLESQLPVFEPSAIEQITSFLEDYDG